MMFSIPVLLSIQHKTYLFPFATQYSNQNMKINHSTVLSEEGVEGSSGAASGSVTHSEASITQVTGIVLVWI